MSKRIIAIILGCLMIFSMIGCTANPDDTNTNVPDTDVSTPVEDGVTNAPEVPDGDVNGDEVVENSVFESATYGFMFEYPSSWENKTKIIDDGAYVDFMISGTMDAFMSIMAMTEPMDDPGCTLLAERNGWYYYRVIPAADTVISNNNVADLWKSLRAEAEALSVDNFKFTDDVIVEESQNNAPEVSGLAAVIHNARSDEENMYFPATDSSNTDEFMLEYLGLTGFELEDYALAISMMNVSAYGVMILDPVEGDMDAAMSALNTWVENTQLSYEMYLIDQYEIACNAIVETVGDYAVVVMCADAENVMANIRSALANPVSVANPNAR